MLHAKVTAFLLTEDEKKDLVKKELSFLESAVQTRQKLLDRLNDCAENATEIKDLARAIEVLSKEIKQSYKMLDTLNEAHNKGDDIEDDVDLEEMEQKLAELSVIK